MKRIKYYFFGILLSLFTLSITGCISPVTPSETCTILFEDHSALYFPNQIYEVKKLDNLSVSIGVPHGYRISSVNFDNYNISSKTGESLSYDYYTLTLQHIRYSAVIRLTTDVSYTTTYHDENGHELTSLTEDSPHLRFNTLIYNDAYSRTSAVPIGWNTKPDGTGTHIGFGSRFDHRNTEQVDLYLELLACTPAENFSYVINQDETVTITGYHGTGNIMIPSYIDNYPVTEISAYAFDDFSVDCLVLPATLQTIAARAFGNIAVKDFYFFDTITELPEDAFLSYQITNLHINAAKAPVYSGSYFDTLSDKIDYLYSLQDQRKIVLFCGSSARFGYDSAKMEAAFSDYKVVNMGVYAYANMLPQAKLVLAYMNADDILLSSPEFDAIDMQFCGNTALDKETFCMLESNYDMLSVLDCTEFTNVFSAFDAYNASRNQMTPRSYADSPSYYDEDGKLMSDFSYNSYGDYIVFRENNEDRKRFGVKRAYYNADYIQEQDFDGLNAVYDSFSEKGVTVLFTYSPRSNISISEDSTEESILALDSLLRKRLHAVFVSSIWDSLMDPYYFYGTDNHLSTEGVDLHTRQVISDLRTLLEDSL